MKLSALLYFHKDLSKYVTVIMEKKLIYELKETF